MSITEIRAFPVSSTIVMRSTLFALANMGATVQTYNEDSGVIVATVSKWLGLQKQEVVARVRAFEGTCQLELDVPDFDKGRELRNSSRPMSVTGAEFRLTQPFNGSICNANKPAKPANWNSPIRSKVFSAVVNRAPRYP